MPHLPLTKTYNACAFTSKVHKLCRMLVSKGHEVFVYGVGYTDIEGINYVPVVTMEDVVNEWGEGVDNELGYDWHTKGFKHDINEPSTPIREKFFRNTIDAINVNKQPDDFLLLSQGYYHKPIADAVNLYLTCEPGIGYRGSYARFRAFESGYIMYWTYGSQNPGKCINGNHYDRIIPNYFDPDEFTFNARPNGDYLLFVGRLIERKGYEIAFKVAAALGKKMLVAGQGNYNTLPKYGADTEYIGVLNAKERDRYMGNAKAFLAPTIYLEPFGGVAVEAMLTGTPAITTNFGAFTDTVRYGVSGYRCDTLKDFVHNTEAAFYLNRQGVYDYAKRYLMSEVNELFEKWWADLYQQYLSTTDPAIKGWHHL